MYLWIVHHGETFSMISTNNIYYLAPTFVCKPLSYVDTAVENPNNFDLYGNLKDSVKQEWFAPLEIFNNSMGLTKQVTFRSDEDNLVSSWNEIGLQRSRKEIWSDWFKKNEDRIFSHFKKDHAIANSLSCHLTVSTDIWNELAILNSDMQRERLEKGLFYMHWMSPSEMQNSLNI